MRDMQAPVHVLFLTLLVSSSLPPSPFMCSATQPPAQPASSAGQSRSPTSVAGIIHGQGHCHGMDVVVAASKQASKQASKHQAPAGKQNSTRDEARRAPIVQPYPLQPESMQRFSLHHSKSASCLLLIYSTGSRGWVATRNLQPFLCYALPCLSVPSSPYSSLISTINLSHTPLSLSLLFSIPSSPSPPTSTSTCQLFVLPCDNQAVCVLHPGQPLRRASIFLFLPQCS